jgi:hypothetical protein
MRLVLGVGIGLLLGAGGAVGVRLLEERSDPCLGRCGDGTECVAAVCTPPRREVADGREASAGRRAKKRRPARSHTTGAAGDRPARRPSATELKPVSVGPSLNKTEILNAGDSEEGGARELGTEEITRRFRALDPRIVACIDRARADSELAGSRVEVGFRIERSGRVERVRVTAPALLQSAGLADCVRAVVQTLRLPPSTRASILSFPFTLD